MFSKLYRTLRGLLPYVVLASPLILCLGILRLMSLERDKHRSFDIRWYEEGLVTSTGEPFTPDGLTFASRSAIIGTVVKVEWNGKSVIVRCNDRGPNEVELTRGAFEQLEQLNVGVLRNAKVTIIKYESN